MRRALTLLALLLTLTMLASPVAADDEVEPDGGVFTIREWGLRAAGGVNPSSLIEYYALHGDMTFRLWSSADRWLSERGITGRWIVEPWVAFVNDNHGKKQTASFEIGVSALFARLTFGDATVRPFIEGGEGILYTDLRKQGLGSRVQFTSQFGAGIEYQLSDATALTFGARFRHMSNAGLGDGNPGVNTLYGLLGVTFR